MPDLEAIRGGEMERAGSQYLVILSIYEYSTDRLVEVGQGLTKVLGSLSTEPIEVAFHSVSRDIIAYLVRSKLVAGQIRAAIESPDRKYSISRPAEGGFLRHEDSLLILELGDDKDASQGLSRALTWLQHH